MDNNLITNLGTCMPSTLDVLGGNLNLLYYSHIPTVILSLFFGFFVLIKGGRKLLSVVFFFLALSFATWSILDLFTWLSPDTRIIMFTWSVTGLIEALFFVLSFYFVYVFIEKKDISFKYKVLGGIILLPLIIMIPTKLNLSGFNIEGCYALESNQSLYYKYFIEIILSFAIILFLSIKIKQAGKGFRKPLWLLSFGVVLFLLSFFSAIVLSGYFVDNGWGVKGYSIEIYGLFGTTIFMGFLGYLIVKFKVFNIKLIGAQALVALLIFFVGSLIFIQDPTKMRVVIWLTLILSVVFGWFLVKSVKLVVNKSEELEVANKEISERGKKLEEIAFKLDGSNAQLKITNNKLNDANDKLKVLDEAKSAFFARASHDLRNPVTSISGSIFLVMKGSYGAITDKTKDALQKSFDTTKIILDLIEDFLTASQLETGGMKYNFVKCKLEDICQAIVGMLELKAEEGKIYLKFQKLQENLPELLIDEKRIRESITNLIDNAVKYTESGGVTVAIEKAELSNHKPMAFISNSDEKVTPEIVGPVVRVTVSDTGMGIPKDGIQYLFAKFSRGTGNASRKKSGHGLGLYFCRMMIEDNGGKVWAESDGEDKGSRFILEFPINAPENILNQIEAEQQKQEVA